MLGDHAARDARGGLTPEPLVRVAAVAAEVAGRARSQHVRLGGAREAAAGVAHRPHRAEGAAVGEGPGLPARRPSAVDAVRGDRRALVVQRDQLVLHQGLDAAEGDVVDAGYTVGVQAQSVVGLGDGAERRAVARGGVDPVDREERPVALVGLDVPEVARRPGGARDVHVLEARARGAVAPLLEVRAHRSHALPCLVGAAVRAVRLFAADVPAEARAVGADRVELRLREHLAVAGEVRRAEVGGHGCVARVGVVEQRVDLRLRVAVVVAGDLAGRTCAEAEGDQQGRAEEGDVHPILHGLRSPGVVSEHLGGWFVSARGMCRHT